MKVNGRKSNIKALMGRLVQHHATWFTIHYRRERERERGLDYRISYMIKEKKIKLKH